MGQPQIMLYGATGYTGRLTAEAAVKAGLQPVLAGRNTDKVREMAEAMGLRWAAFGLEDPVRIDHALQQVDAVAHMAGPFSATAKPMLEACLRTGRHYLDITGEIDVFEMAAARGPEAKAKGIMVMPGVGFDVVPSDCLAAHMKRRLPDADKLDLCLSGLGTASRGTLKTMVEGIRSGTRVLRNGQIVTLPRPITRSCDFGKGAVEAIAVGWGDISTAYHSTGIPNVTVYFEAVPQLKRAAQMGPVTRWLLGTRIAQGFLKRQIDRMPEGPSAEQRASGHSILIGEATNAKGQTVRSRLTTPEGYSLTAATALGIAKRVLAGDWKPGFQTPSMAYGPDLILDFENCRREDLNT